jgi:hypothetical protein
VDKHEQIKVEARLPRRITQQLGGEGRTNGTWAMLCSPPPPQQQRGFAHAPGVGGVQSLGKKRGRVSEWGCGDAGPDTGPKPEREAAYPSRRLIRLPARHHVSTARGRVLHADDAHGAQCGPVAIREGREQAVVSLLGTACCRGRRPWGNPCWPQRQDRRESVG